MLTRQEGDGGAVAARWRERSVPWFRWDGGRSICRWCGRIVQERSLQRPVGHALFTGSFRARAVRLALLQLNNVHVTSTQILRFWMNGSKVPCPSRCRWDIFRLEEGRIVLRAGNMHFCMDRQVNSPVADSKFSYHPLKLIMIINCDPDIYIEPPNLDGDY